MRQENPFQNEAITQVENPLIGEILQHLYKRLNEIYLQKALHWKIKRKINFLLFYHKKCIEKLKDYVSLMCLSSEIIKKQKF